MDLPFLFYNGWVSSQLKIYDWRRSRYAPASDSFKVPSK